MGRSQLKQYPEYTESPYDLDAVMKSQLRRGGKDKELTDHKTGEVLVFKEKVEYMEIQVDALRYIKLYMSSLQDIAMLTEPGKKLLFYLMSKVKPNVLEVIVNVDEFLDWAKYKPNPAGTRSKTHYYRGIKELLDKDYIARKKYYGNIFYINVNRFFNGDRIKAKSILKKQQAKREKES